MNVFVVGLNHQIQQRTIRSYGEEIVRLETDQKVQFANVLERIIRERHVQFVGEEAEHGVEAIAGRVASDLGSRYANIEMPPAERERRSIPRDYTKKDSPYSAEQKLVWQRQREDHMFERAFAEAGEAESVLILCGREHTEPLAERFRQAGHSVEQYDVNREGWYVEDWLLHVLQAD